jgi:hypothetical protein
MNSQNEINDSDEDYESDGDCESSSSESCVSSVSDVESFSDELTQLRKIMASINSEIETLETQLISIQRPIEALHMEQLGDIPFLESSPFRHTMLKFKSDVHIPGLDASRRHAFADIMKHVRAHLFDSGAVQTDGSIKLNKDLRKILVGIRGTNVSYIDIMNHMRQIVH